jgi:hypothetical protein
MSYPVRYSAWVTFEHSFPSRGRLDIGPDRLFASLGLAAMVESKENYVVHQAKHVSVFVSKYKYPSHISLLIEGPTLRALVTPRFRSSAKVLKNLEECGFASVIEPVSPLIVTFPMLIWRRAAIS